jgi:hypothetical protein
MNHPYVDASEVTIEVKNGNVTLEGTVTERRMKHEIEDIAESCMGVKDIDNKIRVSRGDSSDEFEGLRESSGSSGSSASASRSKKES